MAFTKAPVFSSYQVKRVPAVGSPFVVSNPAPDHPTLNYIDCHPLSQKMWATEPKHVVAKREAVTGVGLISTNNDILHTGTQIVVDGGPYLYFKRGNTYYKVNWNFGFPSASVQTTTTIGYPLSALAVDSTNTLKVVYIDPGMNMLVWDQDGSNQTNATIGVTLDRGAGLVFMNGYLFGVSANKYGIYNSGAGGNLLSWNTTDFISAEMYSDPINFIAVHKNHLVAFGSRSIEFFYDAAQPVGSPLARQEAYAVSVGAELISVAERCYCKIDDDLYFIGRGKRTLSLFRIRDFKVEEVESQLLQNKLMFNDTGAVTTINCVETIYVNNNPMVAIGLSTPAGSLNYVVYFPENDSWWEMTPGDYMPGYGWRAGPMFTSEHFRINNKSVPLWLQISEPGSSVTGFYTPDSAGVLYSTATVYSTVIDFDSNFNKHLARVDAIGDFGTNNLTLSFCPNPGYAPYTQLTPLGTPGVTGPQNNTSWFNLGRHRRFSFKLELAGSGPAYFDGYEVTYNLGYK